LGAFPVGHPVNVFYDPAKPGDAVLQRRRDKANVFVAVAGWVLVVMGIAALFARRREIRKLNCAASTVRAAEAGDA
jgi:hypothetical protein